MALAIWRFLASDGDMRNPKISGRAFSAVIAAELLLIAVIAWIAAGVPGLYHNQGPPSVTIQFAPAHPLAPPARVHNI